MPSLLGLVIKLLNKQIIGGIQIKDKEVEDIDEKDSYFKQRDRDNCEETVEVPCVKSWTVKDPKTFTLPPKINETKTAWSSGLKILECKMVKPMENQNIVEERVSFEELVLKTIARNDPPRNPKKRINGAEILTSKDVMSRNRKEKEEKEEAKLRKAQKCLRKNNKSNNPKKIPRKQKETKINRKTTRREISDSDSVCSYTSNSSIELEDIDSCRQNTLEEVQSADDSFGPLTITDTNNQNIICNLEEENLFKNEINNQTETNIFQIFYPFH